MRHQEEMIIRKFIRLYERLGFRSFGTEPQAVRIGEQPIDERHMTLEFYGSTQ